MGYQPDRESGTTEELRDAFQFLDWNGDGLLSPSEILNVTPRVAKIRRVVRGSFLNLVANRSTSYQEHRIAARCVKGCQQRKRWGRAWGKQRIAPCPDLL